jgi:hypothetical protein
VIDMDDDAVFVLASSSRLRIARTVIVMVTIERRALIRST